MQTSLTRLMAVGMVHVGNMRMGMHEPFVEMQVRMRFAWRIIKPMDVLVVRVVHMRMTVLKRLHGCVRGHGPRSGAATRPRPSGFRRSQVAM